LGRCKNIETPDKRVRAGARDYYGGSCYVGGGGRGLSVTKGITPRRGILLLKLMALQPVKKLKENKTENDRKI
jgi:hypothetical protein